MSRMKFAALFAVSAVIAFFASCTGPTRTVIECGGGGEFICPSGMYCDLGDNCGGIDRKGTCRPFVHDCQPVEEPVCGCDGKTHQSACYANGSGVTVNYKGACIAK